MLKTIVIYDDRDPEIGLFFEWCFKKTSEILDENKMDTISSRQLSDLTLAVKLPQYNNSPFLFITFTHGSETEILKEGNIPFLSTTINVELMKNSFSYCFACYAGKTLGPAVIAHGGLCFVGYKNEIYTHTGYFPEFSTCLLKGLQSFLMGKDIRASIEEMKEAYNRQIDSLYEKDYLVASLLLENRDALVVYGNKDLKLSNFLG